MITVITTGLNEELGRLERPVSSTAHEGQSDHVNVRYTHLRNLQTDRHPFLCVTSHFDLSLQMVIIHSVSMLTTLKFQ